MTKNNKGFTAIELLLCIQIGLVLAMGTAWCVNLYKLTQCDFASPYKGEAIHAVGIFPPAALVTVWFSDK
jgi:prepilin-type N-terminal cleavage/methylation domain-containing protein